MSVASTSLNSTVGSRAAKLRRVDPATTEKHYGDDEVAFIKAVDKYRHANGRPFVTPIECLSIAKAMGYSQVGVSV